MRPRFIGQFDSASTLVRVLAAALEGGGTVGLGLSSRFRLAARASQWVPLSLRARLYSRGAMLEAVPRKRLNGELGTAAAAWFASNYRQPERFPALFIGATSGAVADLAAAMRAPWLPQTFLTLIRASNPDVDDIRAVINRAGSLTETLARCFPRAVAHQMHDPQNDRLTVRHASYLRMKWRRLPEPYRSFIEDRLEPGGTIFIVGCRHSWPALQLAENHLFQVGGHGGSDAHAILRRYGLERKPGWEPRPEAEWGYDDALTADLVDLAENGGFRLVRLSFEDPQDLSPTVSCFFRDHVAAAGPRRLVVTSFNMLAPAHVLRTGAIPHWAVFNDVRSLERLRQFLRMHGPFDEIDGLLFQNGVKARGQASAEDWRGVLEEGARRARLLGVTAEEHPFDFAAFDRYRRLLLQAEAQRPAAAAADRRIDADEVPTALGQQTITVDRLA